MKKIIIMISAVFFIILFSGCEEETTLRIQNESSFAINEVRWNSTAFTTLLGSHLPHSISVGGNNTQSVDPGSGYLFFRRLNGSLNYRTVELLTIVNGEQADFFLLDSTLVYNITNSTTGTWGSQP